MSKLKIGLMLATKDLLGYNDLAPLGLGYLVSYAKREMPELEFKLIEKISDSLINDLDIVGISAATENYYIAQRIAKEIKFIKKIPVIIGGPHISMIPVSLSRDMDIGVIGEGEVTFTELIKGFLQFGEFSDDWIKDIKGLVYRNSKGELIKTGIRDFISEADLIPFPDREFLNIRKDFNFFNYVFTSRGCPYQCKFCTSSLFWRRGVRFFSAEYVVSEIEHLINNYNLKYIIFFDDLFIADKARLDKITDLFIQKNIPKKVRFSCQVRANLITEDLAQRLKKINVTSVGMGLESFSDPVLQYLKGKSISREINQRALDILKNYDIQVNPAMIFGTHLETEADLIQSLKALYHNLSEGKIESFSWGLIRPYPGTGIWDVALNKGLVKEDESMDWELFSDWSNFKFFMNENYDVRRFEEITLEWFTKSRAIRPDAVQGIVYNDQKLKNDISAVKKIILQRLSRGFPEEPGDRLVWPELETAKLKLDYSYNCKFSLNPIEIINGAILKLSGTVINTGLKPWDNLNESDETAFNLGVVIQKKYGSSETFLESRYYFNSRSINPDEKVEFDFNINIFDLEPGEYNLRLNLLKEGSFWLDDLGIPAQVLGFKLNQRKHEYNSKFSLNTIEIINGAILKLSGTVTNTGSKPWDNLNEPDETDFRVGVRIYNKEDLQNVIKEGRFCFQNKCINSDETINFNLQIDVADLKIGCYVAAFNILKEHSFWFDNLGILPNLVTFELSERRYDYNYKFSLNPIKLVNDVILKITGKVENAGLKPWDNIKESDITTFNIGAAVFKKDQPGKFISEWRSYLGNRCIKSGERIDFELIINIFDLGPGKYTVKLDVLKERNFWFSDLGISPVILDFQKTKKSIYRKERKITYCKRPQDIRILFISPTLPLYDKECGGNRLFEILRLLSKHKYKTTFLCEKILNSDKKYLEMLKRLNIKCFDKPFNFISSLKGNEYNICIFGWYTTAEMYMELVRKIMPQAKLIIDSVDVHWLREKRGIESGELDSSLQDMIDGNKIREKRVYESVDNVWAVTENDREAILEEVPCCKVKVVSSIHRKYKKYVQKPIANGVIFVGGFNHPPNKSAALWGYEICKKFREKTGKDIIYYIVGVNPPADISGLHDGKNTIVTGHVKDLYGYYSRSRIMIAPIKYGAGIKGKICHSICSGIPVITTDIGNEGLGLIDKKEALIANTTEEFVDNLSLVFSGKIDLSALNKKALVKILDITNEKIAMETIESSFVCKPVVIAIISHNKKGLLKKCIDSIIEKTNYPDYKIAVVCNACQDGSKEMMMGYIKRYKGLIDFYYNKKNEFFVKPNNFVINKYPKCDIVLVNNDIQIVSGDWLASLYEAAYTSDKVGAAGGKILDERGRLSEAGAELYNDGTGRNMGRGDSSDRQEYNIQRYVGYVSGCLLYMRRDMIKKFGVFDEDFSPMYYEDAAWQYTLHKNGIKTIYAPGCVAIHNEGSSAGTDISTGMKRFQEINRVKFLSKFKNTDIESLNS